MSSRMAYFGGSPEEKEKWKETILQKLSYLPNDGSVIHVEIILSQLQVYFNNKNLTPHVLELPNLDDKYAIYPEKYQLRSLYNAN